MLVSECLERAQSELLHAGHMNLPAWDIQSGTITSSATALTVDGRADDIPAGSVIEWDDSSMELALVKSATDTAVTLQTRGYLESTAASHADDARILISNPFPKITLFNSLKAILGSLYGHGIYIAAVDTSNTYSSITPISLPSGAKDTFPTILVSPTGTGYAKLVKGTHFEVLQAFTPPKVQFLRGAYDGAALTIQYKKDFTRPTTLADDLTTLGVSEGLQESLPLGIAGRVLQGRDVPKAQADHIRRVLETQSIPLGAVTQISRQLWAGFLQEIQAERVRLMEANPPTILYG